MDMVAQALLCGDGERRRKEKREKGKERLRGVYLAVHAVRVRLYKVEASLGVCMVERSRSRHCVSFGRAGHERRSFLICHSSIS